MCRIVVYVTQAAQVYDLPCLARAMKTPYIFVPDIYATVHVSTKPAPNLVCVKCVAQEYELTWLAREMKTRAVS
jgi:hypothetical protein